MCAQQSGAQGQRVPFSAGLGQYMQSVRYVTDSIYSLNPIIKIGFG